MKFTTEPQKTVFITVSIESDGCAVINVNKIGILRLTNSGYATRIINDVNDAVELENLGFKIISRQIEVR